VAAADTNVLVRLLVADHPAQLRAAQRCIAERGPLYVSQVALVETIWVLAYTYRLARRDLGAVVEQILAGADFVIERPAEVATALVSYRSSRADFADCVLLANAQAAGMLPLATFDRQLAKLTGALRIT
jgi:predicted nucleic-acid-binding protein